MSAAPMTDTWFNSFAVRRWLAVPIDPLTELLKVLRAGVLGDPRSVPIRTRSWGGTLTVRVSTSGRQDVPTSRIVWSPGVRTHS